MLRVVIASQGMYPAIARPTTSQAAAPLEYYQKLFANGPARPHYPSLSNHPISFRASPETKLPGLVPLFDFFLDNPVS
jgi:hypothetical protein